MTMLLNLLSPPSIAVLASAAPADLLLDVIRYGLSTLYIILLLLVATFGFHRWILVYLYYKHRKNAPRAAATFSDLPCVTIQLPMYNELYVAQRVIASTCVIDYPKDKLQIQVLDDSTDETTRIASETVQQFAARGYNIIYLHRTNRCGFKAGALDEGLRVATGQFVAIFDADFIPRPDILLNTIHHFTDPAVGMVQVRWDHLNRQHSLLTRVQAILLDAHFMIEHTARNRSGRFMNFNGTAGLWRRSCIEDGGGWQHDTLTEDLDLSYRCQMKGWRFVYLPDITSPAELPPEINAFKQQQFRWTKGAIQTARKMLPAILRSPLPLKVKIEAFFHLLNPMSYLFMSILILLILPVFYLQFSAFSQSGSVGRHLFDLSLFLLASCSASTFYLCSQREIFSTWFDKIKYLPFLMSIGVGMAINNSRGILEALFGKDSAFERTPKFGIDQQTSRNDWLKKAPSFARKKGSIVPFIEIAYGLYMTACIVLCLIRQSPLSFSLPFLVIFAIGYFYVGILSLYSRYLFTAKPAPDAHAPIMQSSPA